MGRLKVALVDIRHRTMGLHSYQMPLGIGLIAAYAIRHMSEIEVRLYKYYRPYVDDLGTWNPDVVGASMFSWNRKLALYCLEKAKEFHPGTLTVLGGPELELESNKRETFLRKHTYVDICCRGEGEDTFLEILCLVKAGEDIRAQPELKNGFYLATGSEALVECECRERISPLDEIPSPYAMGLFDPFFDDFLHPFIETHRGCPFTCRFCHMGLKDNSHITFQSVERTLADLKYCAERYQGRHDIQLCIGDNNFAMFPKDIELAEGIRKLQDIYDWPRYLVLSTGKNHKDRMVAVSRILKWGLPFNMAAQSLTPKVLDTIGRKNISLDVMEDTLHAVNNTEADSYTELIVPLPEETRESFEDTLHRMMDLNLNWMSIITLRHLNGTWLTFKETIDKYRFDIRKRVICRQFGEYDGRRIIETEGAVVATSTMTFEEYCHLRELTYLIMVIYNNDACNPIRRFLIECGMDVWEWIKLAHEIAASRDGKEKAQFDGFMAETRGELFDTEEDLLTHYEDNDSYKKLRSGEEGDNLVAKYAVLAGAEAFSEWLDVAVKAALKLTSTVMDPSQPASILEELRRYIRLVYDFAPNFYNPPKARVHKQVKFSHDIRRWMSDKTLRLEDCKGVVVYDTFFSEDKVRQIYQLLESSHDTSFTIQRIYRDRNYDDLIPAIIPVKNGMES